MYDEEMREAEEAYRDKFFSLLAPRESLDPELEFLSQPAPNIVEWVTGSQYWNVPQTFEHSGQYQFLRDAFNLRCPLCNPSDPASITCWGKGREYLESENLLVWDADSKDFVCPCCDNTLSGFYEDEVLFPYNDLILVVGMRAGKSYTGAHIGGYIEHSIISGAIKAPGALHRQLGVQQAEWFEVTFAASTATQAQDTIYAKYREMRKNSPWIQRYVNWVMDKEKQQIGVAEPWHYGQMQTTVNDGYLKVRYNRIASDSAGVAGKTRLFSSIDEWSRLINSESGRSAQELYRVLNNSLQTVRSHIDQHKKFSLPFGLMVNVTSPLSQDDPAMQHYRRFESGALRRTYGKWCATWEFNPFMPRSTFDAEFEKDPVGAERDFGANPPNAVTPLISDPLRFWTCVDFEREPIVSFVEEYRSDATGKDYITAALDKSILTPYRVHYLFGDAGVNWDAFAIVGAHAEWRTGDFVEEDENGELIKLPKEAAPGAWAPKNTRWDNRPVVAQKHMGEVLVTVIDFVLRLVPTNTRDIWFQGIVDLIKALSKRITVGMVCFDHWSSDATLQQIRDLGIQSHSVSLKAEDFVLFTRSCYNGRVSFLPPEEGDHLTLSPTGALQMGKSQLDMSAQGVALVELLKLQRSMDLKKVYNPNKGQKRGVDSDDLAHCIVGAHRIVQDSVVDHAQTKSTLIERRKKQLTQVGSFRGHVFKGQKSW